MATLDVFRANAFSTTSLTGRVNKVDFVPNLLGSLNIFEPMPVRTRNVWVDRREGKQVLIPTSADEAPPEVLDPDLRDAVPLRTVRLAKRFTLSVAELADIRGYGQETEVQAVQVEFNDRFTRLRGDMDLTHEHHRLGALQGRLLDADGTTVIYDYFAEFEESEEAVVTFTFSSDTFDVRTAAAGVRRSMRRAARGSFVPGTTVHALCGDEFYDGLIAHKQVRETFLNYSAAADLRQNVEWESFPYGGIIWHNYRGTDDNSTVAIASDEAKFFPVGARDFFKKAMSPLPNREFVNTPGRDVYAMTIPDTERGMWVKGELYSFPLYICQQPRALRRGVAA